MFDPLVSTVLGVGFVVSFHAGGPTDANRTPVLHAAFVPQHDGVLIPPKPADSLVRAVLAATTRRPGDRIVRHRLVQNRTDAPRAFATVGTAKLWHLTYQADIDGPDGRYAVIYDRDVLLVGK